MPDNKSRFHFEKGLTFFHKGEYENASTYFKEAIYENPEYSEALYNLSCCCSMIADKENAIMYLHRAAKLNPHCIDWANEDHEFDSIREDSLFQKIVSGESPDSDDSTQEPEGEMQPTYSNDFEALEPPKIQQGNEDNQSAEQTEPSGPPPTLDDGKPKPATVNPPKEIYPPCIRCDGLVESERRARYHPVFMLITAFFGLLLCIGMFVTWLGIFGIFIIAVGLYLFSRIDEVWVCQNCGATGADCGQPTAEREESKKPSSQG
jgi:tetratricopeptide (TPR) repeat protein